MPSEGLRLGRDSGSVLCDSLKKWPFRTGWGGGVGVVWVWVSVLILLIFSCCLDMSIIICTFAAF